MADGTRLRLKRQYSIVAHSDDVVELRHGTWNPISFTLRDDSGTGALRGVLAKLDGTLSTGEIAEAAGVSRNEVAVLVEQLADLDLLEAGPSHALDYYLDHAVPNLLPYPGARGEGRRSAIVLGSGAVPGEVVQILGSSAGGAECDVALANGDLREASSYQSYKQALADGRVAQTRAPLDRVLETMVASLTAFEALNYLLTDTAFTVGKALAVYLPTFEFSHNEVLRLPGCPACGSAPECDDRALYFDIRTLLDGGR